MSTRRPKVPRSAGPRMPLTPASGDQSGAPRARPAVRSAPKAAMPGAVKAAAPGVAKAAAPRAVKAAPRATGRARKAAGPAGSAASPAAASLTPSEARTQQRVQLAGAIRRARQPFKREPPAIIPAEDAKPIPAKSFSGRLLALAVVLVTITVLLAPSVRTYLLQQGELNTLRDEIAALEETQLESQEQLARWEDPAYIKAQARERIFLVMPGETRYVVVGETVPGDEAVGSSGEAPQDLPWVDALWDSIERSATDS
ncbi:FtsB family cell division protein [Arthrobacter sp. Hz1]